jgi:hypothetical protein
MQFLSSIWVISRIDGLELVCAVVVFQACCAVRDFSGDNRYMVICLEEVEPVLMA